MGLIVQDLKAQNLNSQEIKNQDLSNKLHVVLLTAIPESPSIWNGFRVAKNQISNIAHRSEQNFRYAFQDTNFIVHIVHNAQSQDLAEALSSPQNTAVFWLSHAAADTHSSFLSPLNVLLDSKNHNVSGLLQKISPQLRFLALIGCNTESLYEDMKSQSLYPEPKQLNVVSFNSKILPEEAFIQALNSAQDILGKYIATDNFNNLYRSHPSPQKLEQLTKQIVPVIHPILPSFDQNLAAQNSQLLSSCQDLECISFKIHIQKPRDQIQVYINNHYVNMLLGHDLVFQVAKPKLNQIRQNEKHIKIELRTEYLGLYPESFDLGAIEISSDLKSQDWRLFQTSKGEAIGYESLLFRLFE